MDGVEGRNRLTGKERGISMGEREGEWVCV